MAFLSILLETIFTYIISNLSKWREKYSQLKLDRRKLIIGDRLERIWNYCEKSRVEWRVSLPYSGTWPLQSITLFTYADFQVFLILNECFNFEWMRTRTAGSPHIIITIPKLRASFFLRTPARQIFNLYIVLRTARTH
jgi:hypothetical protein